MKGTKKGDPRKTIGKLKENHRKSIGKLKGNHWKTIGKSSESYRKTIRNPKGAREKKRVRGKKRGAGKREQKRVKGKKRVPPGRHHWKNMLPPHAAILNVVGFPLS